jgi:hypothetical protein
MRQATGNYASGLHVIAGVMALSTILPLLIRPPAAARPRLLKASPGNGPEMAWKR